MCVSDLKSAGWNFLKFEKVQRNTTMSPLSSQGRCAQDDCNHHQMVIGKGMGIIIKVDLAPLYRWSCIPQDGELQEVETCKESLQVQIEGEVRL